MFIDWGDGVDDLLEGDLTVQICPSPALVSEVVRELLLARSSDGVAGLIVPDDDAEGLTTTGSVIGTFKLSLAPPVEASFF
eukprot:scaffold349106_cov36-Prasinocladus_malaysianus.AAC.1